MHWTAWAWYPYGCKYPSLIETWNGEPTVSGLVVKNSLSGYNTTGELLVI